MKRNRRPRHSRKRERSPLVWIGKVDDRAPEGELTGLLLAYGTFGDREHGAVRFAGSHVVVRETLGGRASPHVFVPRIGSRRAFRGGACRARRCAAMI